MILGKKAEWKSRHKDFLNRVIIEILQYTYTYVICIPRSITVFQAS